MADSRITMAHLSDIGDAIREVNGETDQYQPVEMPDKIRSMKSSGLSGLYSTKKKQLKI